MKILWLTVDRSHRIAQQFDIFRKNVSKVAQVTEVIKPIINEQGQNMWQTSRDLISGSLKLLNIVDQYLSNDSYDFIFCDAFFAYLDEDWKSFGIPSGILIEDVHQEVPKFQIAQARSFGIETIFHRFNFAFHKFHPSAKNDFNCFWLPHSVDLNKFMYIEKKLLDVLHVGVHPEQFYPYRADVVKQLKNKPYFTLIERPKEGLNRDQKYPIDSDYIKLLMQSWITITGGSIFNAPVQKYVEIPASGSLLMSNWFPDLGLLGFVPDVNMVTYTSENLVNKVESLLNNKDKVKEISDKGFKLVSDNHNSIIRSKQFINKICQILNKDEEFPDILRCSYNINFRRSLKMTEYERTIPQKKYIISNTGWRSRIK